MHIYNLLQTKYEVEYMCFLKKKKKPNQLTPPPKTNPHPKQHHVLKSSISK